MKSFILAAALIAVPASAEVHDMSSMAAAQHQPSASAMTARAHNPEVFSARSGDAHSMTLPSREDATRR